MGDEHQFASTQGTPHGDQSIEWTHSIPFVAVGPAYSKWPSQQGNVCVCLFCKPSAKLHNDCINPRWPQVARVQPAQAPRNLWPWRLSAEVIPFDSMHMFSFTARVPRSDQGQFRKNKKNKKRWKIPKLLKTSQEYCATMCYWYYVEPFESRVLQVGCGHWHHCTFRGPARPGWGRSCSGTEIKRGGF